MVTESRENQSYCDLIEKWNATWPPHSRQGMANPRSPSLGTSRRYFTSSAAPRNGVYIGQQVAAIALLGLRR